MEGCFGDTPSAIEQELMGMIPAPKKYILSEIDF